MHDKDAHARVRVRAREHAARGADAGRALACDDRGAITGGDVAYDVDAMKGKWATCRSEIFELQPLHFACFEEDGIRTFYSETTVE